MPFTELERPQRTDHTWDAVVRRSKARAFAPKFGTSLWPDTRTHGLHPDAIGMLYGWHAEAHVEGCLDRTVYGASRTATTSFFTHHLRLISLAAVIGAALPVAIWAKSRKSHLLSGAPLAGLLPVVM